MAAGGEFQVIVVGAGVGGLALARFLRAAGLDPVVVERDDAVDTPAGPVELWPDAMTVLSWLDLAEPVRVAGAVVRTWTLLAADGTVDRRLVADDAPGVVAVDYGRLRATLRRSLPGGTLQTDMAVSDYDETDDNVVVEFQRGVTEPFDVVVGADGVRSTTRAVLGGPDPQSHGTTSVAFPLERPVAVDGAAEQWTVDGSVLRILPTDSGGWGWLTVPSGSARDPPALAGLVADHVGETDWLSRDALPRTADAFLARDDRRVETGALTGSRVALLGDAAHARHRLAGVGPTLALEDAAVLVDALTGGGPSLPKRLAAYACRRRSRIDRLDGTGETVPPLDGVEPRVPHALGTAADIRSARLASSFSGAPPTPAVERPVPEQ